MIKISFDGTNYYSLLTPMRLSLNRIELYFASASDDIDYSNGFQKWRMPSGNAEIYNRKGMQMPDPELLADFSTYKYKWNVLTSMTNGIVLTCDPDNVETEDDDFHPLSNEEIEELNAELEKAAEESDDQLRNEMSTEERIARLEAEIAKLKGEQK